MDDLSLIQILVLSILQAVTEFLPISSSAHLLLPSKILGWPDQGLFFDIAVHCGSLFAVIIYLRKELLSLSFFKSKYFFVIICATIPIIAVAPVVASYDIRWSLSSIAIANIFFAILLLLSINVGQQNRKVTEINFKDGFIIGFWQIFSLISGASRSGTVITGALFQGFNRESAARFSIMLSIPTIAGALFYIISNKEILTTNADILTTFIAFLTTFIVSYFTIDWFIRFVRRVGFGIFIIYRAILGIILLCLS